MKKAIFVREPDRCMILITGLLGRDILDSWDEILNAPELKRHAYELFISFLAADNSFKISAELELEDDGSITLLLEDFDINFGEGLTYILGDNEPGSASYVHELWIMIPLHFKRLAGDKVIAQLKQDAIDAYKRDNPPSAEATDKIFYPPALDRAFEHYAEFPYIVLGDEEQMSIMRSQLVALGFLMDIYDELTEGVEDEIQG